ncbi:MAG: MOSC domain-containing protein [Peptococcaceae bacterium]|nr:MOSC domain-containing protein [Peptococcaceae bacterium]
MTATIYAICISARRGELKKEIEEAVIIDGFGIEGDGHGGDWDRQVTCLNWGSVVKSNAEHNLSMGPGDFAENILIDGLDTLQLNTGDRFQLGESAVLQVSQIGKPDHPSVVTRTFGVSLLPYEGLFCKVIQGGAIRKGDIVVKL